MGVCVLALHCFLIMSLIALTAPTITTSCLLCPVILAILWFLKHPLSSVILAFFSPYKAFPSEIYRAHTLTSFSSLLKYHFARSLFKFASYPSTPFASPCFIFLHSTYHHLIYLLLNVLSVSPNLNIRSVLAYIFICFFYSCIPSTNNKFVK